jgi:hypothetical protein
MEKIRLAKIKKSNSDEFIKDVKSRTSDELIRSGLNCRANSRIAIAVGSRGISDVTSIIAAVIQHVKNSGAHPFIIPAMGSHGGATSQGQSELLEMYGISESATGVPIDTSMDVVEIPSGGLENRIFISRAAYESDGIILINRVKSHTDFHGSYESGLVKMCVIGLGKHAGALELHRFGVYGLRELIPKTAKVILSTGKVLAGVAVIEDSLGRITNVEAINSQMILAREPELLQIAKKFMPSLLADNIDILIIDKMGKDISGAGIDPNVTGRIGIRGESDPQFPKIKSIMVTDLTERSHGNALGIGLADVVTQKLFNKINFDEMYKNAFASSFLERAKIPVIAKNDFEAFNYCLRACGTIPVNKERIIRISDTLHIGEMYVSESILMELLSDGSVEKTEDFGPVFDEGGNLFQF